MTRVSSEGATRKCNYGLPWCWGASCLVPYSAFGHPCQCSGKPLVNETYWTWAGLQSAVSEALSATSLNLKVASRNHCRLCFKNSSKFVTERMETPLDTNCEASPLSLQVYKLLQELSDCKIVRRLLEYVVLHGVFQGMGWFRKRIPKSLAVGLSLPCPKSPQTAKYPPKAGTAKQLDV